MAVPGLACGGNSLRAVALALTMLSASCASAPGPAEVPHSCGLPPEEPWVPLQSPPSGAAEALARMQASNHFHAGQAEDSHALWLRLGKSESGRLAHCEYSGTPACGIGSTVIFEKSGHTWKATDDALLTVCSTK